MLLTRVKTDIRELLSARLKVPVGFRSERKVAIKETELNSVSAAKSHQNGANAELPTSIPTTQEAVPIREFVITTPNPLATLNAGQPEPQAEAISSVTATNVSISAAEELDSHRPSVPLAETNAKEESISRLEIDSSSPAQPSDAHLRGEPSSPTTAVGRNVKHAPHKQQGSHVQQTSTTIDTHSPLTSFLSDLANRIEDCQKSPYGLNVSVNSTTLQRRTKRLYIGLLPEWPVPKGIEDQWETSTRTGTSLQERLMFDLIKAVQKQLGQIESELEHVELELRMLGYATGKPTTVDLKPAILVRCRTKKCRKVLRQAIQDLAYLPITFNKDIATVKLHAPRLANLQARQTASPVPTALPNTSASRNRSIAIALGIVIPVIFALLGLLGFFFWYRRRKKDRQVPNLEFPVSELGLGYNQNSPLVTPVMKPQGYATKPDPLGTSESEYRGWGSTRQGYAQPQSFYPGSTLDGSTVVGSTATGSNPDLIGFPSRGIGTSYPLLELPSIVSLGHVPPPIQQFGQEPSPVMPFSYPSEIPAESVNSPTMVSKITPVANTNKDLSASTDSTSLELDYDYGALIEANSDPSICGLRYRWVLKRPGFNTEVISTIGGILRVDDGLWGLTTAHAAFTASRQRAIQSMKLNKNSLSSQPSINNTSSRESDSESSTEGEELEKEDDGGNVGGQRLGPSVDALALGKRSQGTVWTPVNAPGPMSFAGWIYASGGIPVSSEAHIICDFALVSLGPSHASLTTTYHVQARGQSSVKVCVEEIIKDKELTPGPVLVLTRPSTSEQGYLLPGKSQFSMYNQSFITRKLRLEKPLATGTSGSWVVRDGQLCGYIVAVYEHEPFAHIITAEKVFSDIRKVLQLTGSLKEPRILRVATSKDLKELAGHAVRHNSDQ